MIVVEDRFQELINSLPEMVNPQINGGTTHSVKFGFGDDKELMSYLIANKSDIYPLVWLVTPYSELHLNNKVELERVSFILAVSTNSHFLNRQRFETTYKNVLFPLYDNFIDCIKKSNIVKPAEEVEVIKYPNYSNEKLPGNRESLKSSEKHKTFDMWDAIKITMNCTVNNNCYKGNHRYEVQ